MTPSDAIGILETLGTIPELYPAASVHVTDREVQVVAQKTFALFGGGNLKTLLVKTFTELTQEEDTEGKLLGAALGLKTLQNNLSHDDDLKSLEGAIKKIESHYVDLEGYDCPVEEPKGGRASRRQMFTRLISLIPIQKLRLTFLKKPVAGWVEAFISFYLLQIERICTEKQKSTISFSGKPLASFFEKDLFPHLEVSSKEGTEWNIPEDSQIFCHKLFTKIDILDGLTRVVQRFCTDIDAIYPANLLQIYHAVEAKKNDFSLVQVVANYLFTTLFSIKIGERVVTHLAFPSPLAAISQGKFHPFRGFIQHLNKENKHHLFVGDKKDLALFEEYGHNHQKVLTIVILERESAFYLQNGEPEPDFAEALETHLLSTHFPSNLMKKIPFKKIIEETQTFLFGNRRLLTGEERKIFIDLVYDQIVKFLLIETKADSFNFSTCPFIGPCVSAGFLATVATDKHPGMVQRFSKTYPFALPIILRQTLPEQPRIGRIISAEEKRRKGASLHQALFPHVAVQLVSDSGKILDEIQKNFRLKIYDESLQNYLDESSDNRAIFRSVLHHLIERKRKNGKGTITDNAFALKIALDMDKEVIAYLFLMWDESIVDPDQVQLDFTLILQRFDITQLSKIHSADKSEDVTFFTENEQELFLLLFRHYRKHLNRELNRLIEAEKAIRRLQSFIGVHIPLDEVNKTILRRLLTTHDSRDAFLELLAAYKALREHNLDLLKKKIKIDQNDAPHIRILDKSRLWNNGFSEPERKKDMEDLLPIMDELAGRATVADFSIHSDSLLCILIPEELCADFPRVKKMYQTTKAAIEASTKEIQELEKDTSSPSCENRDAKLERLAFLREHPDYHPRKERPKVLQRAGWAPEPPPQTKGTIDAFVEEMQPVNLTRKISFIINGKKVTVEVPLNLTTVQAEPFSKEQLIKIFEALACTVDGKEWKAKQQDLSFLDEIQKFTFRRIAKSFQDEIEIKISSALLEG